MGRRFGWPWAAYAVSTFGTWLAFDAFALIAILALHAGPAQVSVLAAMGLAVGAVPPVGTAAIGLFGPAMTVVANAVSYLLSAAGIRAVRSYWDLEPALLGRVEELIDFVTEPLSG